MKTLFDYQKEIVDASDVSAALFMKMGTGKTITSLKIAEKFECKKLIVICLKSKIQDWKDEIINETYFKEKDFIVINYESAWRTTKLLDFCDPRTMVIVDESHKMKNPKSKISQYIRYLGKSTKYKLILTGTPQNQEYYDYWAQMNFIDSDLYSISLKDFEHIYVNYILDYQKGHFFKKIDSYNETDKLKEAINKKSFYKDYESNYGEPREIYEKLDPPSFYRDFMKDKVYDDVVADTDMSLRTYLRQCCLGFIKNHKLEKGSKEKWLEDFVEITQDRIVIFVNYNMEIDIIKDLCNRYERPYSIYNGETKDLTNFKNNNNGIAIVNYASGATGINDLCISNIGIFYSPPDGDYILFSQAKSRLDRIGQLKQPIFYYLICKRSIEVPIYNAFKNGEDFNNDLYNDWLNKENL